MGGWGVKRGTGENSGEQMGEAVAGCGSGCCCDGLPERGREIESLWSTRAGVGHGSAGGERGKKRGNLSWM